MQVYQCEDTLEGVCSAIFRAYEEHADPQDTWIRVDQELMLFGEYIPVETNSERAEKVLRTLRRRFGQEDYESLCMALATPEADKAQAVYQTVAYGLRAAPPPGHLLDHQTDLYVLRTYKLAKKAGREFSQLREFLRFRELERGILYAENQMNNQVLPYLMVHFADRFPQEDFAIRDIGRGVLGVHPAGGEWYLTDSQGLLEALSSSGYSACEMAYEELFCYFCHKIAIKERRNIGLQNQMMPKRFQKYTIEFAKNLENC
ncbi:MAG: TIGR03915 family putative DNA repair protein [bacterium]|nr:TIGR03915 family putative DNA repair protein [bacterium]MCM1375436.1 TIGR03915 family putative DNA repair protein [Muribaculum sp.]